MKKLGYINLYPTHEGKEYPMVIEFYEDYSVKLVVPDGTPPHLVQEAMSFIAEGMASFAQKIKQPEGGEK